MRKSGLIMSILAGLFVAATINAAEVKLESLALSSGNGPLSAGPLFEANFSNGQDAFNLTLGERDLYVYYLKSVLWNKVSFGPCLEYFHNIPTVSLMALLNPVKHISALTWIGSSAGVADQKAELLKWRFLFFYQSLSVDYWRLTATGAIMYFGGWQPLVDLKYSQPLTDKVSIFTDVGYNFFKDGSYLLKMGIVYKL
jgi:hypothetical protein